MTNKQGVCQGTVEYLKGLCLMRLGSNYRQEALAALQSALTFKEATLWGPDGPLISILAQEAVNEIKP